MWDRCGGEYCPYEGFNYTSGGPRGSGGVPAGDVRDAVFLPGGEAGVFFLCRADTRPADGGNAKKLGVVIITPTFEKRAAGLYHNTAAIIDADGSQLGIYRKMHIPDDPQYYEKFYFTPGDLGFRAWDTAYARIGVLICWDQWYPEGARLTALQGAQILYYPTAIGYLPAEKSTLGPRQQNSWETVQRGHAVANGCYVAAANRWGLETPEGDPGLEFWGQSFIADPAGQIIAKAPADEDHILIADIDPAAVDAQRHGWPFLRDRRIDAYQDITRRYID
jgi:N-carbamoylputrescine amidase